MTLKTIAKLIEWLLFILIGFWLATSGILDNTQLGQWMHEIMGLVPDLTEETAIFDSDEQTSEPQFAIPNFFAPSEIDVAYIEETIFTLTNDLRISAGVDPLQQNDQLTYAANLRAVETEELFSHTRPDGREAVSVMDEEGVDSYNYLMFGENLAYGTYIQDEEYMANLLFNGWVNSEGHYNNMIQTNFQEIGVGVHFNGDFLYMTQIFGTQQ